MNSENNSYKFNNKIFSIYYFIEGYVQGIPMLLFPPYLAQVLGGSFDIALWLLISFISAIPWSIKLIVGVVSDKWGSKKYGKRFPWISGFGIFGGFWWIMMGLFLPTDNSIYFLLAIFNMLAQTGMAFSDTALDGLILDVTPKKDLGKVQGFTWAFMLLGMGAGGMLLGLIFLALNAVPILFIITGIITMISCSLPYFIKELPFVKLEMKKMGKKLLTIVTKRRNYIVFIFTFFSAITGGVLINFFNYVILIGINVITVEETLLSITSGSAVDFLGWSSVFYFSYGLGTVIGSIISGKLTDKSRKRSVTLAYLIYFPFCLISVLPYILTGMYLIALIYGLIGQIIFGAAEGWLVVSTQTIRGDLTKNYYPELKTTFYAFLISLANLGQNFGRLMGVIIFSSLAGTIINFHVMYFILSAFCGGSLALSFIFFRVISPKDYELEYITGEEEKEVYFA
ncbi:MAG: MFS transporter [Promethearchaeota archaeon]